MAIGVVKTAIKSEIVNDLKDTIGVVGKRVNHNEVCHGDVGSIPAPSVF